MPMRVIGMLLGIPEQDQVAIRDRLDEGLRLDEGVPNEQEYDANAQFDVFSDYVTWRADHPSDDLMTELLNAEFEDDTGTRRTLTHAEIIGYAGLLAGAGNETTTRLIGFSGEVLGRHPEQRAELVADRSLIPNAIEELLRYESPSPVQSRYVTRDVELHGRTVPEGSVMVMLNGSANRDERHYADGDSLRHPPRRRPASSLRLRHPPVPGRGPGPAGGADRTGRGADAVPRVGRRLRPGEAGPHLDRPRVGDAARPHVVTVRMHPARAGRRQERRSAR